MNSAAHITGPRADLDSEEPSHTLARPYSRLATRDFNLPAAQHKFDIRTGCRFRVTPCLFDRKATKAA
ncbi:MAG: hypothetical protein ABL860_04645 [Candidatus Nitrotoga sp.]